MTSQSSRPVPTPSRPPGKLSQALIAHLTAFKGLTSLPLSKVSIWQHGQRRSSSCQPPNKNSSCSPTIGGLLEASSGIMTEREDGETVSPPPPSSPSHSLTCKPQSSVIATAEAFMFALMSFRVRSRNSASLSLTVRFFPHFCGFFRELTV